MKQLRAAWEFMGMACAALTICAMAASVVLLISAHMATVAGFLAEWLPVAGWCLLWTAAVPVGVFLVRSLWRLFLLMVRQFASAVRGDKP